MAGLLLIFLFAAYLLSAFWLINKVSPLWKKGLMLILLILIPTADELYYSYKLKAYCDNEAGIHVNSTIPITSGIYFGSWSGDFYFEKLSLPSVEWKSGVKQELYRLTRRKSGDIKKERIEKIQSQFEYSLAEEKSPPFLFQSFRLNNIKSQKVVSEYKNIAYYGGWVRRKLLGGLSDSGPTLVKDCGLNKKTSPTIELLKKSMKLTHNKSFKPTPKSGAV